MKLRFKLWIDNIKKDIKNFSFKNNKLEVIMLILAVLFYYPFCLLSPNWIRPNIGLYACSYTFVLVFILALFSKKQTKFLFPISSIILYIPSMLLLYSNIRVTLEYSIIMLCYELMAFFIIATIKNVKDIIKRMFSGLNDVKEAVFGKKEKKKKYKKPQQPSISSVIERARKKNEEDGVYDNMDDAFEENIKREVVKEEIIEKVDTNKGKKKRRKRKEEENYSTDSRDYSDNELFS